MEILSLYEVKGWGMPGNTLGDIPVSVILNASGHNKLEYIWVRGGGSD